MDLMLSPFARVAPWVGLVFWSAVLGVGMAVIFKYTSNQRAIRRNNDRTTAAMLGMKLFKDDFGVTMGFQAALLKRIGLRLWYNLPPLLVMIVPIVLLMIQLAMRYEQRPLALNGPAIVELNINPEHWPTAKDLQPQLSGAVLETPAVRDEYEHSVSWRFSPQTVHDAALTWQLDGDTVVKQPIAVDDPDLHVQPVWSTRPGPGFWDGLLHPLHRSFPADSPVQSIVIHYDSGSTPIFGLDVHWVITFFVVSMLFALLSKLFIRVYY
ncbi:MAG: hypothetical protein CMJ49_07080 [Planctomycetaceae bacterium]|nr:hypothetical protein [Planctomycetaceae bacterium]